MRSVLLVVGLARLLGAAEARADDETSACVDAHAEGQHLRKGGHFLEAHAKFLTCSRPVCPAPVIDECADFDRQLDKDQPGILVSVRDTRGEPVVDARVLIDGREAATHLSGMSIPVDPGEHRIQVELGGQIRTAAVIAREGSHAEPVAISFATPKPPAARETEGLRAPPAGAWVAFSVGAIGFGTLAVSGPWALADASSLKNGCGRTRSCDPKAVGVMQTKALVADVGLGVGLAGALTGIVVWAVAPRRVATSVTVDASGVAVRF